MTAPAVFLYNPISRQGHLDAYARLYARALVELGRRVVLVADGDADAVAYLDRCGVGAPGGFTFVPFAAAEAALAHLAVRGIGPSHASLPAHRRALAVFAEEGPAGVFRRGARVLRGALPGPLRRGLDAFAPAPPPPDGRLLFASMVDRVAGASRVSGVPPALILALYLDLMSERPDDVARLNDPDAVPWAGILFHPRAAADLSEPTEACFGARSARGALFLVPSAAAAYARRLPHLSFALAPDVADLETRPGPGPPAEIAARAKGRTVVLLIGTLTPHKGVDTFLDIVVRSDSSRFFFAMVGTVHWEAFGRQADRLRRFCAAPPENAFVRVGYVGDERDYNAFVASCDVLYAAYLPFGGSSNTLSKAAGFCKPVLVTEGTLMAERVLEFGIGAAAPAGDAAAIARALDELARSPKSAFRFDAYLERHSLDALKAVLADALDRWSGQSAPLTASSLA